MASTMPTISVITTVYERTDAALFEQTIEAVRRQSQAPAEWLVLAHGPVTPALEACLSRASATGSFRLLRLTENLGIQGGLRHCLEHAVGDFVLSLDADDLLAEDAIATLTEAVIARMDCRIFHSDEDLLIEGRRHHPFLRPAFDPVHLRMHSYIWHCVLFDRAQGLRLGAYTNSDAEYAQDWDTLLRFDLAGMRPEPVPAVLYHWRQHASSLSNSGTLFDGSIRSIKACLEFVRARCEAPDRYSVAPYPIARLGTDFYLERDGCGLPAVDMISFPDEPRHAIAEPAPGFGSKRHARVDRSRDGVQALERAASPSRAPYVMLLNGAIHVEEDLGYRQAIRHFEMHPEVVAVSGVVANRLGSVLSGCPVAVGDGYADPIFGASVVGYNRSMFNVWKAHCIDAVAVDFALVRTDFLMDALAAVPPRLPARALGWWLGLHAASRGQLTVFEPILIGFIDAERELLGDRAEQFYLFDRAFGRCPSEPARVERGASRLIADFLPRV